MFVVKSARLFCCSFVCLFVVAKVVIAVVVAARLLPLKWWNLELEMDLKPKRPQIKYKTAR